MAKSEGWSQKVTESSYALNLERGVFALEDPRENNCSRSKENDLRLQRMSCGTFSVSLANKPLLLKM